MYMYMYIATIHVFCCVHVHVTTSVQTCVKIPSKRFRGWKFKPGGASGLDKTKRRENSLYYVYISKGHEQTVCHELMK